MVWEAQYLLAPEKAPGQASRAEQALGGDDPCPKFIYLFGLPSSSKESTCNARDVGDLNSITGSGRFPLQCSCLENPMDRGAWRAPLSMGHKESGTTERLSTFICLWCTDYSLVAVNRLLIAVASFVAEHGL